MPVIMDPKPQRSVWIMNKPVKGPCNHSTVCWHQLFLTLLTVIKAILNVAMVCIRGSEKYLTPLYWSWAAQITFCCSSSGRLSVSLSWPQNYNLVMYSGWKTASQFKILRAAGRIVPGSSFVRRNKFLWTFSLDNLPYCPCIFCFLSDLILTPFC